jgi:hypothetical protein
MMLRPGNVDVFALGISSPYVKMISSWPVRIEFTIFVNVERNVENVGVIFEYVLNAIAVVDVPVQDQDFSALIRKVNLADFAGNTNIVEETEATR